MGIHNSFKARTLAALLLAVFLAIPSVWAASDGKSYRLHTAGLACPFCSYGIEKKLNAVKGVGTVVIDINEGVIVVTMKAGAALSEAVAKQAVSDAGFTLGRFEPVR